MRNITGMLTPQGLKVRLDGEFCEHLPLKDNKTVPDLLKETEIFVCNGKWVMFILKFRTPQSPCFSSFQVV